MNPWMWMIVKPFVVMEAFYFSIVSLSVLGLICLIKAIRYFLLDTKHVGW